jgi:hypothetical protein
MSLYSKLVASLSVRIGSLRAIAALAEFKDEIDDNEDEAKWMQCLENAGVDNWSGIEYAQELYEAEEETT